MKSKIFQIDGGIGRVICATPAIQDYARQCDTRVIVVTSWTEVFWFNTAVYKVYKIDHPYLWDDVIRHGDFFNPEPYHSSLYYNQEHHLIDAFQWLINQRATTETRTQPQLFLSPDEITCAKNIIQRVKKEMNISCIAAYQPYGAGAAMLDNNVVDNSHRSLSKTAAEFIATASNVGFVNCSHIFVDCKNVWNQQFSVRELFAIVSQCDFVVAVDSSVAHIGVAFDKRGISLLGATFMQNVGYNSYRTFQRKGFPKNYFPNRFHGFVDENRDAMNFDTDTLQEIVASINTRNFEEASCVPKF